MPSEQFSPLLSWAGGLFQFMIFGEFTEYQLPAGITPGPMGVLLEAAAAWHGRARSVLVGRQMGMTPSLFTQSPTQFYADYTSQSLESWEPQRVLETWGLLLLLYLRIRTHYHLLPGTWVDMGSGAKDRVKGSEFAPTKCHLVSFFFNQIKSDAKSRDAEVWRACIYVRGIWGIFLSCQCMPIGCFIGLWCLKMLVQEFKS